MFQFTDTSEKGFQHLIVKHLTSNNGFIETNPNDFDKEFCFNTKELLSFIERTQPERFDFIQRKGARAFLVRLDGKIKELGVVEVLRKGIKHIDDKIINLYNKRPVSTYDPKGLEKFNANLFSVSQEVIYSDEGRLDLVVFLNGLPIITLELKNPLSGQTVQKGIRQYQNDRDPKDKLFTFARCMVHFAADTELVYMSSHLKGKATNFLPFNKGLNDGKPAGPYGAGNPVNPNGLKTHYLWEQILTKEMLSSIIEKFAFVVEEVDEDTGKTSKKNIFPRYHQLMAVRQILAHAKKNGVGQRYLIQHSAGSGKSNSISWLAHQLISLHDNSGTTNIFDTAIVITDRTVLDKQLKNNIKQFAQTKGIVEWIDGDGGSKTSQLREAIANKKKIIICTIQTFPHLLKEMQEMNKLKFAIIIDEAHSSQSGNTSAKMNAALAAISDDDEDQEDQEEPTLEDKINQLIESKKMIKNGSYFSFTATPKNKTLETFGVPRKVVTAEGEKNEFDPFHLYSMKQAIEEEFILDVLENYTTYSSFYKLVKSVDNNPEFETKQAQKKLRAYVEGHEFAISEKAKIMIDHFHRDVKDLINGHAKAMVVTKSIVAAIKYKQAFDEYLREIKSPFKAIVAFSGKKSYKGIEYDEVGMNNFDTHKKDIPKHFKKNVYRFLIVANKYQTGFDEPLLHTLYVDKKLRDVQAVQTLSRLNRSYKPLKKDTFVLDFYNSTEEIKKAFEPYYTTTILSEETNPNKLNDLVDALDNYDVYSEEIVKDFFEKYINKAERNILDPLLDACAHTFKHELNLDKQLDFRTKAKQFLRVYSYLSKILDYNNHYWEQLWWFLKLLVPKLLVEDEDDLAEGILDAIDMDSYRPSKQGTEKISLVSEPGYVNPIPVGVSSGVVDPELDTLENIISIFNHRFGDIDWSDKDKVNKILTQQLPAEMQADANTVNAMKYSDKQNAKIYSDKKIEELMQQYLFSHTEIFKKFTQDKDFQRRYKEFIFDTLWSSSSSGKSLPAV